MIKTAGSKGGSRELSPNTFDFKQLNFFFSRRTLGLSIPQERFCRRMLCRGRRWLAATKPTVYSSCVQGDGKGGRYRIRPSGLSTRLSTLPDFPPPPRPSYRSPGYNAGNRRQPKPQWCPRHSRQVDDTRRAFLNGVRHLFDVTKSTGPRSSPFSSGDFLHWFVDIGPRSGVNIESRIRGVRGGVAL